LLRRMFAEASHPKRMYAAVTLIEGGVKSRDGSLCTTCRPTAPGWFPGCGSDETTPNSSKSSGLLASRVQQRAADKPSGSLEE